MSMAETILRAPLYQRCQLHLLERIRSGEFAPSQLLPTEQELCETYRISVITVRRALGELRRLGVISSKQGVGSFVSPPREVSKSLSLVGTLDDAMSPPSDVVHVVLARRSQKLAAPISTCFNVARTKVESIELLYSRCRPFFCHAVIFVSRQVARALSDDMLNESTASVFRLINSVGADPVAHADQRVEAVLPPPDVAEALNLSPSIPVLRATRGFFSRDGALMHSALIHYHPEHFSIDIRFIP